MVYDGELKLLCETFRKSRVPVSVVDPEKGLDDFLDENFKLHFLGKRGEVEDLLMCRLQPGTVYRLQASFGIHYLFLLLPSPGRRTVLCIGPYLFHRPEAEEMMEIGERFSLAPGRQRMLERFFDSITILAENSHLFAMVDAFAGLLFGSGFEVEDISDASDLASPLPEDNPDLRETVLGMKIMEERYDMENALLSAVSMGDLHKVKDLLADFATFPFEKRLDDPLRNLKNFSIVMNTLLRKAVEQGGVHPLYIDRLSTSFAVKIEQVPDLPALHELMDGMYHDYCRLVQKHAAGRYSPPVRRVVMMIDDSLSEDLSLSALAARQNMNASYLSALFKRETGKTVTEYVNEKRMALAAKLFRSTSLQIQAVALHCGILDVQYFSKLFKRHFGRTPKEYQRENRK